MKSTTNRPSDDARTVLVWRRVPVASVTVTRAPGWKLVPTNDGSPSRVGRIDAAGVSETLAGAASAAAAANEIRANAQAIRNGTTRRGIPRG